MRKNVAIGIAAGVAAVVVIGIIAKKTGVLDSLLNKIRDFADDVEDRFADLEKFGMEDVIPKGEDKNVTRVAGHA
ncbi:YtxH domain-containing protein [Flavobacterium longum]|uniref:hypothetical protein n=1 Tax=Flavobacterium longum TaxID=1299340 RepID=UPI0039E74175